MSRVIFPAKRQGETVTEPFDFTSKLAVGETISTQSVSATVYSGTDANPSAIISGVASASGAIVSQKITGGVTGVLYSLVCVITTSLGQTLSLPAFLAVIPDVT